MPGKSYPDGREPERQPDRQSWQSMNRPAFDLTSIALRSIDFSKRLGQNPITGSTRAGAAALRNSASAELRLDMDHPTTTSFVWNLSSSNPLRLLVLTSLLLIRLASCLW